MMQQFNEIFEKLPEGWLEENEALLLFQSALKTQGPMLEIGSYFGRSAALLASTGRRVLCIDDWSDEFCGPNITGDYAFDRFKKNTAEYPNIDFTRVRAEKWSPTAGSVFELCYLDGDHSKEGTITQIKLALQCKAKVIAIHDVNDSGGGKIIRDAAVELLGAWTERVHRLAVWCLT